MLFGEDRSGSENLVFVRSTSDQSKRYQTDRVLLGQVPFGSDFADSAAFLSAVAQRKSGCVVIKSKVAVAVITIRKVLHRQGIAAK